MPLCRMWALQKALGASVEVWLFHAAKGDEKLWSQISIFFHWPDPENERRTPNKLRPLDLESPPTKFTSKKITGFPRHARNFPVRKPHIWVRSIFILALTPKMSIGP